MKIYLESHGCSRRKLDVAKFHRYFSLNGYTIVEEPQAADIILVTTCAFKYDEEEESLQAIEQLAGCGGRMVVYGCLPVIAPAKFKDRFDYETISPKEIDDIDRYFPGMRFKFSEIDDANLIANKINYSSLPDALKKFTREFEFSRPFLTRSCRYVRNKYLNRQQQYYLFTSRGCLGNCSYCAVKFAVGTLKSKPLNAILHEFARGLDQGYINYSILGDDVGAYGQDSGGTICELLSALLEEVGRRKGKGSADQIRLHVEEINPRWIIKFAPELTRLLSSEHVASILCPIQSGNKRILGLMNRNDDIDRLMDVMNEIHRLNPKIELKSQVIVGFPTETEAEFKESLTQLSKVSFSNVVLFPYDDKENTKSNNIFPKISEGVKDARVRMAQVFLRQNGIKSALCCNE